MRFKLRVLAGQGEPSLAVVQYGARRRGEPNGGSGRRACSPSSATHAVRPGATGLRIWRRYSRIRDETWLTPYTNCNYSYRLVEQKETIRVVLR
jgi:hypothetical protein